MTSLDVSKNTALAILNCNGNSLSELNVSQNTALVSLACSHNNLAKFDVSKNTKLAYLNCNANYLTVLDATNMAFNDEGGYDLYCGRQRTPAGMLTLTLRNDQKPHWNSYLKEQDDNTDVVLAP